MVSLSGNLVDLVKKVVIVLSRMTGMLAYVRTAEALSIVGHTEGGVFPVVLIAWHIFIEDT